MNDGKKYEQLADTPLDNRLPASEEKSVSKCEPSESGKDGTFAPGYESFASTNFPKKRTIFHKLCTPLSQGTPPTLTPTPRLPAIHNPSPDLIHDRRGLPDPSNHRRQERLDRHNHVRPPSPGHLNGRQHVPSKSLSRDQLPVNLLPNNCRNHSRQGKKNIFPPNSPLSKICYTIFSYGRIFFIY